MVIEKKSSRNFTHELTTLITLDHVFEVPLEFEFDKSKNKAKYNTIYFYYFFDVHDDQIVVVHFSNAKVYSFMKSNKYSMLSLVSLYRA